MGAGPECRLCFHVNPPGAMECEKCGETLSKRREYFVRCAECNNEIILDSIDQTEFYCEECSLSHTIDGLNHRIQVREVNIQEAKEEVSSPAPCDSIELILQERVSNYRIHIGPEGGILGRYGDFDPEFFQKNNMLMVHGEHLRVTHDGGDWYVEHIGEYNPTRLDGMKLEKGLRFILRDGQTLRLANISFKVVLESQKCN